MKYSLDMSVFIFVSSFATLFKNYSDIFNEYLIICSFTDLGVSSSVILCAGSGFVAGVRIFFIGNILLSPMFLEKFKDFKALTSIFFLKINKYVYYYSKTSTK